VAAAICGVGLASIEHQEGRRRVAAGVGLALLAACGFGFYFPWMHAAGKVDFWWASMIFRTTALLIVAAAVTAARVEIRLSRRNVVLAALAGVVDTAGNVSFAASSQEGLVSLTAVLASLYPIITVLLAASILLERVAPLQRAGIALTLAGVVLIGL
jgi:drug/metabolite transporter (DMT)-like permease